MTPQSTHPTNAALQAYVARRLPENVAKTIEEHLKVCSQCRQIAVPPQHAVSTPSPTNSATEEPNRSSRSLPEEVPDPLLQHPKYRIVKKLGAGGMGVVFRATHTIMGRDVAIKVVSPRFVDHPAAIERFRREITSVARLDHINIARAYDAEQVEDLQMLVMEYVDGWDLEKIVKRKGRLPIANACNYVRQAAKGLQHAFEQGMIHRDIKPSNLMLTREGFIKILDFGLARFATEQPFDGDLTQEGPMGTPCYLSPEQSISPKSADIRSDLYSLGCTLFFLLAGRPPFLGETKYQVIDAHNRQTPPRIETYRPEVPKELGNLLDRMLSKKAIDRPQTPVEVVQALVPFAREKSTPDRKDSIPNKPEKLDVLELVQEEEILIAEIVDAPHPIQKANEHIPSLSPMLEQYSRPLEGLPQAPNLFDENHVAFPPPLPRNRAEWDEPIFLDHSHWGSIRKWVLLICFLLLVIGGVIGALWYAGIFDEEKATKYSSNKSTKVQNELTPIYASEKGRFRVRFPENSPKPSVEMKNGIFGTQPVEETHVQVVMDGLTFQISVWEHWPWKFEDSTVLLKLANEILKVPDEMSTEETLFEWNGLEGMRKVGRSMNKSGGLFRSQLLVYQNRIFRVRVDSSKQETLSDANIEEFFASFRPELSPYMTDLKK